LRKPLSGIEAEPTYPHFSQLVSVVNAAIDFWWPHSEFSEALPTEEDYSDSGGACANYVIEKDPSLGVKPHMLLWGQEVIELDRLHPDGRVDATNLEACQSCRHSPDIRDLDGCADRHKPVRSILMRKCVSILINGPEHLDGQLGVEAGFELSASDNIGVPRSSQSRATLGNVPSQTPNPNQPNDGGPE